MRWGRSELYRRLRESGGEGVLTDQIPPPVYFVWYDIRTPRSTPIHAFFGGPNFFSDQKKGDEWGLKAVIIASLYYRSKSASS